MRLISVKYLGKETVELESFVLVPDTTIELPVEAAKALVAERGDCELVVESKSVKRRLDVQRKPKAEADDKGGGDE